MEGKLFLTSGGYINGQRSKAVDEIFELYFKGKNVLVVDNGTITGSNQGGKKDVLENLTKLGCNPVCLALSKENIMKFLDYDAVYILGGDLTPLIELANSTNWAGIILEQLKRGGVIVGESAGSMIFGKNLRWAYEVKRGTKPKWDVLLDNYNGLGIVDINLFPHWNKVDEELKKKTAKQEKDRKIKITRVEDGDYIPIYYSDLLKLQN